jgi:hypothetical protein
VLPLALSAKLSEKKSNETLIEPLGLLTSHVRSGLAERRATMPSISAASSGCSLLSVQRWPGLQPRTLTRAVGKSSFHAAPRSMTVEPPVTPSATTR